MDKAIERNHCEQFLEIYEATRGFDKTKLEKQESPDFRLEFEGKAIGIEHTRLHRSRRTGDLVVHHKSVNEVMQKAHQLFYDKNSLPIDVNVYFKNTYGTNSQKPVFVSRKDVSSLARYIANFLTLHLNEINYSPTDRAVFERLDLLNRELRDFPEKISRISAHKTPMLLSSWMTSGGGIVPNIIKSEELSSAIDSKNKTSESYKEGYDKLWLLIVEDSSNLATYFDFDNFNADDRVFKTAFDKIFILRRAEDKLYELKTVK